MQNLFTSWIHVRKPRWVGFACNVTIFSSPDFFFQSFTKVKLSDNSTQKRSLQYFFVTFFLDIIILFFSVLVNFTFYRKSTGCIEFSGDMNEICINDKKYISLILRYYLFSRYNEDSCTMYLINPGNEYKFRIL